jgi:hypothetical protein
VQPKNAVVEFGWCSGKYTDRSVGKVEDKEIFIKEECPFRHECQQSIYVRPLVQLGLKIVE